MLISCVVLDVSGDRSLIFFSGCNTATQLECAVACLNFVLMFANV